MTLHDIESANFKLLLVIVSGPPCTGKTTLARYLASQLELPLIHKDSIKELLFDYLGWSDREWSKKLGRVSIEILYHMLEAQLQAHTSCIVESVFRPQFDNERLQRLQAEYGFMPLQIQCVCDGPTLLQRFKQRAESSTSGRHAGHGDASNYDEFTPVLLQGCIAPLDLDGPHIEVDTTDFANVDYQKIVSTIKNLQR
jgi:predicted kinase